MSAHNNLGKAGEDAAAKYLEQNGYTIRDRNWRKNHLELDIVAVKDKELIIVEVKTRSNTDYIEPQDAVNWQKIRRMTLAQPLSRKRMAACQLPQQSVHIGVRHAPLPGVGVEIAIPAFGKAVGDMQIKSEGHKTSQPFS